MIKEYFSNYFLHQSDVVNMSKNSMQVHQTVQNRVVTLVDTGENTMTGGRIKKIQEYVKNDELFCLTYGDGLGT